MPLLTGSAPTGAESTLNGVISRPVTVALAVGLTLATMGLGACSETKHGPIYGMEILDGDSLRIYSGCPDGSVHADVDETPERVSIRVTYTVLDDVKCSGMVTVDLAAPLGDRLVIDQHTGAPIEVASDARCPDPQSTVRCADASTL